MEKSEIIECSDCGKTFETSEEMELHVTKYSDELRCHFCEKVCKNEGALRSHRKIHTKMMNFNCNICKMSFNYKGELNQHMLTHKGDIPYSYECGDCGKSFSNSDEVVSHTCDFVPSEADGQEEEVEEEEGEEEQDITETRAKPSNEKIKRWLSCEFCGKKLKSTWTLRAHRRIHTGEKPFRCDLCGNFFRYKGDLTQHKLIHTGQKPYQCGHCGKFFRRSTHVKYHIKTIHYMEAVPDLEI